LIPVGPSTVLPEVAFAVDTNSLKSLFTDAGVPFPVGSSIVYHEHSSTIIVHNTPENLETFERVLDVFNSTPPQVEIEAKFVQISQNDLDELGFDWQVGTKTLGSFDVSGGNAVGGFPPGTPATGSQSSDVTAGLRGNSAIQGNAIDSLLAASGFGTVSTPQDQIATVRGILTNPQFQLTIKALAQKQSTDLLSAPKVVTTSGGQAQIRVAQEFIYPTTFTQPTATAAGGGTTGGGAAAVTPSIPSGFASRSVGVVFNVSPVVGADGYTINLTLIPQVTDFLGFINYGGPISLAAGNNVVTTFNDIKQPLFSTRDIITSVVIYDGQTVVLGGLITEQYNKIDDKTPFLGDLPVVGRLFRSKTTQRSKQNVLIFVTARLIDPAGNPVHRSPLTASSQ
jgi:general secretion pathway protein D